MAALEVRSPPDPAEDPGPSASQTGGGWIQLPIEQSLLLIGVMVAANAGVLAIARRPRQAGQPSDGASDDAITRQPAPPQDRALLAVSILFLAAAAVAVIVSGSFTTTESAIYVVVAIATMSVVTVTEVLPVDAMGSVRPILQAAVAIVAVTLLVALTGGVRSPFVVGYFLIVGAATLSADDRSPALLSVASSLAYLFTIALAPADQQSGIAGTAWALFNVLALALLASIATVIGRQQRRANQAAMRLADFDPLTGLYTRTHLFDAISREIARSGRVGRGFCLLMVDLDGLKPINDTFGHQVGDRVLQAVTEVIRRNVRQSDLAARYGGDEFVIVLPETASAGAQVLAEKLRREIGGLVLRADARPVEVSVSIGLASHPEDGTAAEGLMASVDAAMYESKRRGKNQVVSYVTMAIAGGGKAV